MSADISPDRNEPRQGAPPGMKEPRAEHIVIGLSKVHLAMRMHRDRGKVRRSALRNQILAVLGMEPNFEATPGQLAGRLGVLVARLPRILRSLEKRGPVARRLIEEAPIESVRLTAKGQRKAADLRDWPEFLAAAAPGLSRTHQDALLRTVEGIIQNLLDKGEISIAEMCIPCRFFRPNVHGDAKKPHHCAYVDVPLPAHAQPAVAGSGN